MQASGLRKFILKPELQNVNDEDLQRIHCKRYLNKLQTLSTGQGDGAYLDAFDRCVIPQLEAY